MTTQKRNVLLYLASLAVAMATGCQGVSTSPTTDSGLHNVNHIIFMMQENRSFDAYFGKLNDYRASAFGLGRDADDLEATFTNPSDDGSTIGSFHLTTGCIFNTTAAWLESWGDMNRFDAPSGPLLLDGFVHTGGGLAQSDGDPDTKGVRSMGFYNGADLPSSYWFATQFATSDRFYTPAPAQTEVVRLWSMAATSQGFAHPPGSTNSHLTATTIFQLLDKAGVSWKIYSVDTGSDGKLITSLRTFQPYGLSQESRIVPISQFFTDLQNGTLPQFAYIEPAFLSGRDEHPGSADNIGAGAQVSAQLIEALMNSSSWKDSVFIKTFDEGGGLFDHVGPMIDGQSIQELKAGATAQSTGPGVYPTDAATQNVPNPDGIPPQDLGPSDPRGDFTRTGFRVPLMVVSPFAKPHYVSHTPMDLTAVLKFVEKRFGLPNLTRRDAAQADMQEFFDFSNAPNRNPPPPPSQPGTLPCTPAAASAASGSPWSPP